jgi:hypothetical protein
MLYLLIWLWLKYSISKAGSQKCICDEKKMNRNLQIRSLNQGLILLPGRAERNESMNEKIVLKNGKEYPLVIGGTSSTPSTLRLIFQTAGTPGEIVSNSHDQEPLEDIVSLFADAAATEQIKTINEDGSTLAVYDGYTVLDNPKSIDDNYLITPEQYGEDGAVTAEAVYGRVALLTLSQPGVGVQVDKLRADVDYVAIMAGIDL